MINRGKAFAAGAFYVLWLLLIVLLCLVDRQPVGPEGSVVGLASLNTGVMAMIGVGGSDGSGLRMGLYSFTQYLGYLAILVVCVFAFMGLVQLIRRRSLKKVDRQIIAMGFLFAAAIILYVFFEKVVVNCRPFVLPGETGPEPSFPSSHTVLVMVIMGSAGKVLKTYIKKERLCVLLRALAVLIMVVMVIGRLLCGCHWFTDILGGILVSCAMLALFDGVISGKNGYPASADKEIKQ